MAEYSVCMTNRDTAPVLDETLRSILNQAPPGTEVVVVDGGSRDASLNILRAHGSHVRVIEGGPMTRGAGREAAWRAAVGKTILQLDTDRPLIEGGMGALLRDYADVRRRYGDVAMVSEDIAVYPRRLLEEVNGYNPSLNYGEDWEVYDKLMRRGSMVFVGKYYTRMNWSLEVGRPPLQERIRRAYELARDTHRLGLGFWSFMARVRRTRGLTFALFVLPPSLLGHLRGRGLGKITDCISPRVRTVEV